MTGFQVNLTPRQTIWHIKKVMEPSNTGELIGEHTVSIGGLACIGAVFETLYLQSGTRVTLSSGNESRRNSRQFTGVPHGL